MTGDSVMVRWRLSALLVGTVITVGLLCSYVLLLTAETQQDVTASVVMDQRVQVVETQVTAEVRRYVDTATDLAAAIGAQNDLSADDFIALTSNLSRERLPGISGTSLVVPVTDRQIPQTQRLWRSRGNPQLTLVRAGTADEHLFSVLNRRFDGSLPVSGRDYTTAAEPTQAMLAARGRDQVTASATYVLLMDRDLPASQQQMSFVLAAPINGGVGTDDAGQFRGWLLMGLRGRDFITETMQLASQDTVAVTLLDDSTAAAAAVRVASVRQAPIVDEPRLERLVTIQVAGRTWQLQVQPTTRFMASIDSSRSAVIGTTGVLFTLLFAMLVGILSTSRSRALAKVDRATTALRADITRRELVEAALREREEELHLMALTDSLTGLANRRAFMDQLDQSDARALRENPSQVCVLFCDVDHFKSINDTYGHTAGDAVLCEVAARLKAHFRTEDTIGRLGGDEFAVICQNGSASTQVLLDRIQDILAMPYTFRDQMIAATVSIGMASPEHRETSSRLLERADHAMYLAKAARDNAA